MFNLWRHKETKRWYVCYGPRGKRRISTGTCDRAEAEIFRAQFIAGQQEPAVGDSPTVGAILAAYEADKGKDLRGKDALKYGVIALTKHFGNLLPAHITPTQTKRYALQRGAKPGTILRDIGILRAAMTYALQHKMIAERPIISNPVPVPKSRNRWITKEEAGRLLKACHEPHIRLFVILALGTCARSGALMEAKWDQIDWTRRTLDLGEGHGNKNRAFVPLNDQVYEALRQAKEIACSEYIIEYYGRGPVDSVKRGFAAACRRAGIEGVSPHVLRHSGATWMAIDGVPLSQIARMLGDSERMVEKVYAKHTPEYLKGAASALQFNRIA